MTRKALQFRIEYALARLALGLFRALGPVGASNVAGWLFRSLGPLLPVSRVAHINLQLTMPELDLAARRRIVRGVWENAGRTLGEFPHLGRLPEHAVAGPGWFIENVERIDALAEQGGPAILFSGHFGNWEMMPAACAKHGVVIASFYRAPDNPAIDRMIGALRAEATGAAKLFPKGTIGAKQALVHLARGGFLGILVDQKMNDGVKASLFGRPAMTAPALAAFALRLKCPVIPGYVMRTGPARFHLVAEEPLVLPDSGDREADILTLTQMVNDRLEAWMRARPESWLWLHRRFDKALYQRD
jgi:KDO2-lipid IV(A) lauroyltransferase